MPWTAGQVVTAALLNVNAPQEWTNYTPTVTNMTVGNGAVTGRYVKHGKTVHFWARFAMSSTSAMGTSPSFSLPVKAGPAGRADLNVFMQDAGSNFYWGRGIVSPDATTVSLYGMGASGAATTITATAPFVWNGANQDDIWVSGTYEGI